MDANTYPMLSGLGAATEVQGYTPEQLRALADESRAFLIETIGRIGGHLGAALGVVELTVALFHEFDFLRDRIAWDVGHQAHVYKMLTGRAGRFAEYGTWEGLCKFLERKESPYDHMGAGHASTSISAALGMAVARDLTARGVTAAEPAALGSRSHVMAVIGDGAMTGGLAYEALNMAGSLDLDLLVVLNDNGMSIDDNVGAFSRTVTRTVTRTVNRIAASGSYNTLRSEVKKVTQHVPFGSEILKGLKHMERTVMDYVGEDEAAFFQALGFRYFGPVDGHDLGEVVTLLKHVKTLRGPILVHLRTVKGKGLGPEIEGTFAAHAVSPATARGTAPTAKLVNAPPRKSWTGIFSEGLRGIMAADERVVALTAAMASNTGLAPLAEAFPGRVLDMGIAEANAYCSAAGMAIGGLKPFVTVYSTFSQRAFDQLIHDIALQHLPVRVMLDRGGFVGADGPTHHGAYDLSYLRLIPGFVHMAPRNEVELRRMLLTAHAYEDGPIAMRYARGDTEAMTWEGDLEPIPVGQGECLSSTPGSAPGLLLVAIGTQVATALAVAEVLGGEGTPCSVVDARFVKPLDEALLLQQAGAARGVLTLEENSIIGGLGEGVLALLAAHDLQRPTRVLGIPDSFVGFGSQGEQLRQAGLTVAQVADTARELWRIAGGEAVVVGDAPIPSAATAVRPKSSRRTA